ncbi:DUF2238 domain-containing protein [Pontixanthobacter aestiaquae]|uniref:DUF2238 domain-containing protein n=2 Tax=Pontixanthobacter aestiaquae TaxID=1509367 RepID=A0A844Z935_9SPHN|nr:DUF2238 domain-containing protein [Pontixanthobacter aestiaquae]MDN3644995.1 DUF2238 domain-containing protein [Pontixanthobacter aestiaquae]MXO84004.1 DUF2238 domain-containing protein [Pontixanthobacter aestiaquae]
MRGKLPRFQVQLIIGIAIFVLLCLIDTPFPSTAPLQSGPTLVFLGVLAGALRRWPMPDSAVLLICIFLVLHTIGARYIYSYVPYDVWLASVGLPELNDIFSWERNHYDRLVHFGFGVLMVHPLSQVLVRYWSVSPGRALYVAVEFIVATSALYEIFEWLLTLTLAPEQADAYNGQQGDMWDAQKDMALAAVGAVLAALFEYFRFRRKT